MAARQDTQELKRQAIASLAASRTEISGEIRHLRENLNPKAVMHRVVGGHKIAVACVAVGAVATAALLVHRRTRTGHKRDANKPVRYEKPPEPTLTSQLLRILAGALVPALVKSVMAAPLANLHKAHGTSENPRQ